MFYLLLIFLEFCSYLNLSMSVWCLYIDVFSICVFYEKEVLFSKID